MDITPSVSSARSKGKDLFDHQTVACVKEKMVGWQASHPFKFDATQAAGLDGVRAARAAFRTPAWVGWRVTAEEKYCACTKP
jgi:hypothetical protein